jgi:hypothetical protein
MFNQTLERDLLWGSWADAYVRKGGEYRLKLSSPKHDVSAYAKVVPAYLAAGRLALKAFNATVTNGNGLQFQLPFGLAMVNVRSVQLFHFPPSETSSYSDYLYSPTNRRWEALLLENAFTARSGRCWSASSTWSRSRPRAAPARRSTATTTTSPTTSARSSRRSSAVTRRTRRR